MFFNKFGFYSGKVGVGSRVSGEYFVFLDVCGCSVGCSLDFGLVIKFLLIFFDKVFFIFRNCVFRFEEMGLGLVNYMER